MATVAPPRPQTPATGTPPRPTPTPAPGAAAAQTAGQAAQGIGKRTPEPPSPRSQSRGSAGNGRGRRTLPAPSSVSPHTAVVLSMVGTGVVIVVADAMDGHLPRPRSVLALGVVYVALAAMADLAPRLAVPFSALVFTGVLLSRGSKALAGIQHATGSTVPPESNPGPSNHPTAPTLAQRRRMMQTANTGNSR